MCIHVTHIPDSIYLPKLLTYTLKIGEFYPMQISPQ